MQLGQVLVRMPRDKILVQTKVQPTLDPQEFLANFELSMRNLQLDHVDLLALHGINSWRHLHYALRPNGCLAAARQLQREHRTRFIGFSTHASTDIILQAIQSGEFDYVNLHWYFVNDLNEKAITAAHRHDMGVFIISPNDKGGRLYEAPAPLIELCQPLSPMQFNALYCLNRSEVHTLSCGAARPGDFDTHISALEYYDQGAAIIEPIVKRLRDRIEHNRWP